MIAVAGLISGSQAAAQTLDVMDPREDYVRILQISGQLPASSFSLRPLLLRGDEGQGGAPAAGWPGAPGKEQRRPVTSAGVSDVEVGVRMFLNSRHDRRAANDGFLWQGRGLTTALDVSATAQWKGLTLRVNPSVAWVQNADFPLAPLTLEGMPEYAYPWRRIDWPQRFGPKAFWWVDPGQSELRLNAWGATVGFGTRNLWWGPGIRNSIVMSNNAGGFPHAFLGTRGPRDIGIGLIEASWIMGRLSQSDYFDPDVQNRRRYITGLVVAYSPSFLDGFSVGFSRVFYGFVPEDGQPLSDLFLVFQGVRKNALATSDNPTGDDERDQMISLFGRWVFSESGAEVYFEWARNDHAGDLYDFIQEPEHSQGYTLGLQKAVELSGGNHLALRAELTHLQREPTYLLRESPVYYTHHIVTQGYTHRGQIIGAGVGPGGIQQHVGADLYTNWGRAGVMLQRRVHDNDAFYTWAEANDRTFDRHHVSFDLGLNALTSRGDFELGASAVLTREINRWFYGPHVWNLNLGLSARWRPRPGQ